MRSLLLLSALAAVALADVYLHNLRGQNDRCDEKSNNRNNAQRLWDSENNAAGGYATCSPHEMFFYEGTELQLSFYSQHSCGNGQATKSDPNNPESTRCQHILQLGCEDAFRAWAGHEEDYRMADGMSLGRPGAEGQLVGTPDIDDAFDTFGDTCTQRKPKWEECAGANAPSQATEDQCNNLDLANGGDRGTFNGNTCKCSSRKMKTYGYHEPEHYWQWCRARTRNEGLVTYDQNVRNEAGALRTRQEPNSQRYGFECVEERDYYPYWHPSPWRDIAVFTTEAEANEEGSSLCTMISEFSQNVAPKHYCGPIADQTGVAPADPQEHGQLTQDEITCFAHNNQGDCIGDSLCQWIEVPAFNIPAPFCGQSPRQTDNRLGNILEPGDADSSNGAGLDALATYTWTVPDYLIPEGEESLRCTVRLRYNISTSETLNTDDSRNDEALKNNPRYTYGMMYDAETAGTDPEPADYMPLRFAINTAQFGRTFQDRSYIFEIRKRPAELQGAKIHNLNVRGKRGNIAQVRNCVEYDFHPTLLRVNVGDYVHFQWCGSDYNNNGNAGEGRQGTDRSNIVHLAGYKDNIFFNLPNITEADGVSTSTMFDKEDLMILGWLNQKKEYCNEMSSMLNRNNNDNNQPRACNFLNSARTEDGMPTPYFSHIAQVKRGGTFMYMSSRNNNFTNRSQKGVITTEGATGGLSAGAVVGIVVGSIVAVAVVGGAVALFVLKGSSLASFSSKV